MVLIREMKISVDHDVAVWSGGTGVGDYGIAMEIDGDVDLAPGDRFGEGDGEGWWRWREWR